MVLIHDNLKFEIPLFLKNNTALHRGPEIQDTEISDVKKENNDDNAEKLINLHKAFKIEKRVFSYTIKL